MLTWRHRPGIKLPNKNGQSLWGNKWVSLFQVFSCSNGPSHLNSEKSASNSVSDCQKLHRKCSWRDGGKFRATSFARFRGPLRRSLILFQRYSSELSWCFPIENVSSQTVDRSIGGKARSNHCTRSSQITWDTEKAHHTHGCTRKRSRCGARKLFQSKR